MVEALISEQRASDEGELPKELVQDVESEPASFQEACSSKHALICDKAMSAEFEGLLGAGTLSLIHISEPTRRYAISYAVFCLNPFATSLALAFTIFPVSSAIHL